MTVATQPHTKNTLPELIDLKRHTDHKLVGMTYIMVFFTSLYFVLFDVAYYETNFLLNLLTPVAGCLVTLSALRNFKFLSKKAENPGMFAKNRTFSYAFLKENLWFQAMLGWTLIVSHPLAPNYIPHQIQIAGIFFLFFYREFVPKTSYTSWEQGNSKVNSRSNGWVTFINAQVKIVRWNYVVKKTLLFYLFLVIQAEWLFSESYMSQTDRWAYYLLCLDAMHNITTTFFLQTLKFKGFISAETFSFLFNVSPLLGLCLTFRLFMQHRFVVPYALSVLVELWLNLEFIYPSKSMSFEWKNRAQVFSKASLTLLATAYLAYVHSQPALVSV